jgi:DNA polymerase-3 subunit alpha
MQEDIMKFLYKFCGYSMAEADLVRRGIAKKKGTEQLLPEIEERFIKHTSKKYNVPKEKCAEIIKPFLQIVLDSSLYAFSWNHSDAYSIIGYMCGWLRYYYPIEFITVCLNVWHNDQDKTIKIIEYAKQYNIEVKPIKFGKSKAEYFMDKENNVIYRGCASIKYLNEIMSNELYILGTTKTYNNFIDLLVDLTENTSANKRQIEILIILNYFDMFGKNFKLLKIFEKFNEQYNKNHKETTKEKRISIIKEFANSLKEQSLSLYKQIDYELSNLGGIISKFNIPRNFVLITDIDTTYAPRLNLYGLNSSKTTQMKIDRKTYNFNQVHKGDIIQIIKFETKQKQRKEGNEYISIAGTSEYWLKDYRVCEKK